jgi:hypothetical protein
MAHIGAQKLMVLGDDISGQSMTTKVDLPLCTRRVVSKPLI